MEKIKGNPDAEKAFIALRETYGHLPRGTLIPWPDIEKTIGGGRHDTSTFTHWWAIVRFCKWLYREREIIADKRQGVGGIKFTTSSSVTRDRTPYRGKKARRQQNMLLKELRCADQNELTMLERRLLVSQLHNTEDALRVSGSLYREHERELKGTPQNPKRPG